MCHLPSSAVERSIQAVALVTKYKGTTESLEQKEEDKNEHTKSHKKLPNRRPCITTDVGEGISITISYHPDTEEPVELFVTSRGKKASDGPMTDALYNLGVTASKLMQKEGF